ncbi:hypothetical protein ElyMa_000469900 [Elysia marginata]|uniref:Uncharacterized protein n=1 Tax=Elysia marginata TaxID=1093978 RepID=A0AAV4FRD5_9GAST|nr:hypothetical protein ElyMa_000469900 [Elysia marginata]
MRQREENYARLALLSCVSVVFLKIHAVPGVSLVTLPEGSSVGQMVVRNYSETPIADGESRSDEERDSPGSVPDTSRSYVTHQELQKLFQEEDLRELYKEAESLVRLPHKPKN